MRVPASGVQHNLRFGEYEASIASVGASLRSLTYAGRDLVVPFDADQVRPAYRGATLAPWPNRVVDGVYEYGGRERRLALTEPSRAHALHGLAAWLDYQAVDKGTSHVALAAVVEPQEGYPWRVRVVAEYRLDEHGLTQTVTATNLAAETAPWGTGPHPYLVAGPEPLDEWMLELPASEVLQVSPDRLVPTVLAPVDEAFDFRVPRALGAVEIDNAFTALERTAEGTASVRLSAPGGTGVAMSWDTGCPWVQIHTADLPGGPAQPGHRAGLAVEPMTCAPDAFNAAAYPFETGLIDLDPGRSVSASWRIHAF